MNKFSRFLIALAATPVLMAAAAVAPASAQGMADDSACVLAGLLGEEFGLCNAYCEAMDCDSDNPQASTKACEKVKSKFEAIAFDPELPCLYNPSLNAPPTLDLNASDDSTFDATATFVSYGGAVPIAVNVEITDSDGSEITSATVTLLSDPLDGVEETLSLTTAGESLVIDDLGGNWNFDSATGVLTITGDGTLDLYAEILQEVLYDNSDGSPSYVQRSISVAVSDGIPDADSNTAVSRVTFSVGCPCTAISSADFLTHPGSVMFGRIGSGGRIDGLFRLGDDADSCWARNNPNSSGLQIPYSVSIGSQRDGWTLQFGASETDTGCFQWFGMHVALLSGWTEEEEPDGTDFESGNIFLLYSKRDTRWDPEVGSPPQGLRVFTPENASACEADRRALIEFVVENLTNEAGERPTKCDFQP